MKELTKTQQLVLQVGAVLMVLGAVLFLMSPVVASVLFGAGALGFGFMQLQTEYQGHDFVLARLRRQQMFGAVCLILAAVLMTMQAFEFGFARHNEWVVCVLIGALVELYTTLRISAELKKEDKK